MISSRAGPKSTKCPARFARRLWGASKDAGAACTHRGDCPSYCTCQHPPWEADVLPLNYGRKRRNSREVSQIEFLPIRGSCTSAILYSLVEVGRIQWQKEAAVSGQKIRLRKHRSLLGTQLAKSLAAATKQNGNLPVRWSGTLSRESHRQKDKISNLVSLERRYVECE